MQSSSILIAAATACCAAPAAVAGNPAVEAPIRQMEKAFNKGDIPAVKAQHIAAPTIVDDVAPFTWTGPAAFDSWLSDLSKAEAADGKSGGTVTFSPVVDEVVSGNRAYVVTRSTYTYQQKGRTMREDGYTAFVLTKIGAAWKVASWSWASPKAAPAK